ncbi:hypothetical protein AXF42_Ash007836 [Apostasia shenzhenica]|uniref:GPI ethanolamine phosphate transferase 3 n=1 Tax=Apostasia shenzhenica TaxID=1088818 RepID=A0A2I0B5H1_9ASPA|nr:hypothetical protein AXF42_Ash007836 [Apostasia shenzhenica]
MRGWVKVEDMLIFVSEKKPWMDKLQVLQKLVAEEGLSSRIFKAIADPPTTSLQRLKVNFTLLVGLTTGGLPTFIDVGNSFGAPAIVEDNLILQVDNGVIDHLLPSLHRDDWDVLIAHFLGVEVVQVLKRQSGPGCLHENTLLLVLGDHGQTLNGDHGGGTTEEVETALFAMSLRRPPTSVPAIIDTSFCNVNLDRQKICIGVLQQVCVWLDFAVTVTALLGIPFPFGSIGRVNPELYALAGGTWDWKNAGQYESCSNLESWMLNYVKTLCINSWQVKRYIDLYSATSVIGLPTEDLHRMTGLYAEAQGSWYDITKMTYSSENCSRTTVKDSAVSVLWKQIEAYSRFLKSVAELARSTWTEFNLVLMFFGLCLMLASLCIQLFLIRRVSKCLKPSSLFPGNPNIPVSTITFFLLVAIRAFSFLSNSFILEEGRVSNFLLGTTGILNIWFSLSSGKVAAEGLFFLVLNLIIRLGMESGISKETLGSGSSDVHITGSIDAFLMALQDVLPILVLSIFVILLCLCTFCDSCCKSLKHFFTMGTVLSYMIISVHWISDNSFFTSEAFQRFGRTYAPRVVYAIGLLHFVVLVISQVIIKKDTVLASNSIEGLAITTTGILSAWNPTILILLGRQGPYVALLCIIEGWCMVRSQREIKFGAKSGSPKDILVDPMLVLQWSLLAVCLFFYTGHWCTFDGLHYAAAFIGFEHFNIIRQGTLLAIDTFGVSHIIPVFSLPILVISKNHISDQKPAEGLLHINLSLVWGLFAPKYVFDALGLLLTDALICLASLLYF